MNTLKKLILWKAANGGSPLYERTIINNPAVFTTDVAKPLKVLSIPFLPVQSGSGDPSPDNVRHITGWTGLNINRTGKNLLDVERYGRQLPFTSSGIKFTKVSDGVYHANGTASDTSYFNVTYNSGATDAMLCSAFRGKRLYLSVTNDQITPYVGYFKQDGTFSQLSNGSVIPDDAVALRGYIRIASGTVIDLDFSVQLELGSTATAYEPYSGTTIPVSWQTEAGTVYGGTLDALTGVLTVDMASVELRTLTWGVTGTSCFYNVTPLISNFKRATSSAERKSGMLCSIYPFSTNGSYSDSQDDNSMLRGITESVFDIRIRATEYGSDTSAFKSAMSGVYLVYELATPVTYQLDPVTLSTLVGDNVIWTDTNGDNTIVYLSKTQEPEEPGEEPGE